MGGLDAKRGEVEPVRVALVSEVVDRGEMIENVFEGVVSVLGCAEGAVEGKEVADDLIDELRDEVGIAEAMDGGSEGSWLGGERAGESGEASETWRAWIVDGGIAPGLKGLVGEGEGNETDALKGGAVLGPLSGVTGEVLGVVFLDENIVSVERAIAEEGEDAFSGSDAGAVEPIGWEVGWNGGIAGEEGEGFGHRIPFVGWCYRR